jgi:hypothetical protein
MTIAVETMEHRLVLSPTLPRSPAGAAALVAEPYPPGPIAPVADVGPALYPPDPCTALACGQNETHTRPPGALLATSGGLGDHKPDLGRIRSDDPSWADGPVNDKGLSSYPFAQHLGGGPPHIGGSGKIESIAPHPDPQPPPGGNGNLPVVHPFPSPPPGGNGGISAASPLGPSLGGGPPGAGGGNK